MKRILLAVTLAAFAVPVLAADIGVSISLGEPGFYGRIDIGDAPRPAVIYARPVIAQPPPPVQPIYLHVPPGYERHWSRHCHEYNACGRPVYFVRDSWYRHTYVPHYRHEHERHEHGYGEYRDDEHEYSHHGEGHGWHDD